MEYEFNLKVLCKNELTEVQKDRIMNYIGNVVLENNMECEVKKIGYGLLEPPISKTYSKNAKRSTGINKKRKSEWPNNLWDEIFLNDKVKLTSDWKETLDYVLELIPNKQKKVILYYYRDGMTARSIGKLIDDLSPYHIMDCRRLGEENIRRYSYILRIGLHEFKTYKNILDYEIGCVFAKVTNKYCNALNESSIYTVRDIIGYSKQELLSIDGVGYTVVRYIEEELAKHGLHLK